MTIAIELSKCFFFLVFPEMFNCISDNFPKDFFIISFSGGALLASTISSPWNPASTGPPADTNGSGSDTKNLDVGEIDDVSDVSVSSFIYLFYLFYYKHGLA